MIEFQDGIFHLRGKDYSCLLQPTDLGLELLHFGPPVRTGDALALKLVPGAGWGGAVTVHDGDNGSCPDVVALAWSGSGRGDYRETPLALEGTSTDFRYVSHRVTEGDLPMTQGLPQAQGAKETLELVLEQSNARLTLVFSLFDRVLVRRALLENTGNRELTLSKLMSSLLDLPGSYTMTTFDGGWDGEAQRHQTPVGEARVVNESTTGFSSHRHNPGFLLSEPGATEDFGRVYGFNLIYSGNHYASAQRSLQGLTRVMQGISPDNFAWKLQPGEIFETPEAVLCCSDRGFGGVSEIFHDFVNHHVVPAYWRERSRPVLYNSWEGCGFDFTQHSLLTLAKKAKKLGCELFVLDDGWFGARNSDAAGLGDYNVNRKKLPGGLQELSRRLGDLGLEFGLWFEPESINPDSDLYRAHPDWVLRDAFPDLLSRHQLLLDLTKPEVRDYIVENVTRTLEEGRIRYVKWDMNRHSVALGEKAHRYILGLYDVLRRIFGPRPDLLLESCASGGNRFDLGMLCFSPQIWCSDNTDPVERYGIQDGLSYLYPQSTFGAHVSAAPHSQSLRPTPLDTRAETAFFGILGYELELGHLVGPEEKNIQGQIALYKKYRKIFQFGAFRRIPRGWQVSDGKTTLVGVFPAFCDTVPGYTVLRVKGLKPEKTYRFATRKRDLRVHQFGALVKYAFPVKINPNGLILHTVDHYMTLPDGIHQGSASGAALMAGIPMLPAFRGTGMDGNQRTQKDYGSSLYIIEEAPQED